MKKLFLLLSFFISFIAKSDIIPQSTIDDFSMATVMITNQEEISGGTGVILMSRSAVSYILTNSHICSLIKNGGAVFTWKGKFTPQKYLKSKLHDLCLVKVNVDLEVETAVLDEEPEINSPVYVSGHPYLFPEIVVSGNLSGKMSVSMISEVVTCSEKDYKDHGFLCWWFSGMPIIKTYDTRVISALIAPGNSGSAVYNEDGKIVGLVFAGYGRGITPGIIVPHSYIYNFLSREHKKLKWKIIKNSHKYGNRYFINRKVNRMSINIDFVKNNNIAFPAIFNTEVDKTFRLYKCISLEGESCLKR